MNEIEKHINNVKICSRKNCKHKGKPQSFSNFTRDSRKKDGHRYECKDCRKEDSQKPGAKRKKREYMREYNKKNPKKKYRYFYSETIETLNSISETQLKKYYLNNNPRMKNPDSEELSKYFNGDIEEMEEFECSKIRTYKGRRIQRMNRQVKIYRRIETKDDRYLLENY